LSQKARKKRAFLFAVRDRSNCNYFIRAALIEKMRWSRGNEPQV
jgi:hypothetical protein